MYCDNIPTSYKQRLLYDIVELFPALLLNLIESIIVSKLDFRVLCMHNHVLTAWCDFVLAVERISIFLSKEVRKCTCSYI